MCRNFPFKTRMKMLASDVRHLPRGHNARPSIIHPLGECHPQDSASSLSIVIIHTGLMRVLAASDSVL